MVVDVFYPPAFLSNYNLAQKIRKVRLESKNKKALRTSLIAQESGEADGRVRKCDRTD
jgi:hypothetical protein